MTSQNHSTFDAWLYTTNAAIDGLLVFKSWLLAWQNHHLLGHIEPALFDAVLLDMERSGLVAIINDKTTRVLRQAVCGGNNEHPN